MTTALWTLAGIAVVVSVFAWGWLRGARVTYESLRRDTSNWRHPPVR